MLNKLVKVVGGAIGLFVSPFILLSLVGLIYILFQMVGGLSFGQGFQLFIQVIERFKPFFPYLTFIPMLLIGIPFIFKKIRQN